MTKAKQLLIVQLKLAPEMVIPRKYSEWCEETTRYRHKFSFDKRCHLRKGHRGPHVSGNGIEWDQYMKTVIPSTITNIIFWANRAKTKKSNRTR